MADSWEYIFAPRLAFVFAHDGKAEIGDEGEDGVLAYLAGIKADRHLALGIGRFAGRDALLLAQHGVEAGGTGNTAESLDEVSQGPGLCSRHGFNGSEAAHTRQRH